MSIGLTYKNNKQIFCEVAGKTPYLSYPLFENTGLVNHGFSTRMGGVSTGCFASMNLSFTRGDEPEAVRETFCRMTAAIGVSSDNLVFSDQTHTTNVRKVSEADRGKGIIIPKDYRDVDGMVTNIPGICLATFYADCVPLFFLDPVKKVIGLSHSGWRGTVGKIGKNTVETMVREYGSHPGDILAAIGPSICQECYEVSADVIDAVKENYQETYWPELFYQTDQEHYQLDLWKANEYVFLESGILPEHIAITNVCTHCNSEIIYSHRTAGDKRGNLGAFLALK